MNYFETTGSLWFCSKDEANNFNNDIANTNDFKYLKYQAKLFRNTVAKSGQNLANRILLNTTNAVPLKNLSDFLRSVEMPLLKCRVRLKLRLTRHCVLFLVMKMLIIMLSIILLFLLSTTQNYMSWLSHYQQKTIKNYQNFSEEDSKDQFIKMNIKQKVRIKIVQTTTNQSILI